MYPVAPISRDVTDSNSDYLRCSELYSQKFDLFNRFISNVSSFFIRYSTDVVVFEIVTAHFQQEGVEILSMFT